jgi:hypothetical protein
MSLYSADFKICDVNLPSEFLDKQIRSVRQRKLVRDMVLTLRESINFSSLLEKDLRTPFLRKILCSSLLLRR